jgi:hypothetical protein
LANLGNESETCVGSRVRLVGVSISFEKNFYRLPFTAPLWFAVSVLWLREGQYCDAGNFSGFSDSWRFVATDTLQSPFFHPRSAIVSFQVVSLPTDHRESSF